LVDSERRGVKREPAEGLFAFYWDGDRPHGHRVLDITRRGAYIESDFTWSPGTMMMLTLQIGSAGKKPKDPKDSFTVTAEVVRTTTEGMGLRFCLPDLEHMRQLMQFLHRWNPAAFAPTGTGEANASSNAG
jgi:hypothetical protein